MRYRHQTVAMLTVLALGAGSALACGDSPGTANQAENQSQNQNDEDQNNDDQNNTDQNNDKDPDEDPPEASNEVFVSEYMRSPTEVDPDQGQWVEFYNPTDGAFDLYGCEVQLGGDDDLEIEESLEIGAGEFVTVANGQEPGFSPDLVLEELELIAGGVGLRCDDELITLMTIGNGRWYPAPEGKSVARDADLFDIDEDPTRPWLWCEGTGEYNGSDVGRPGEMPETCPGVAEDSAEDIGAVRDAVAAEYEDDGGEEVEFDDTQLQRVLVTYVRAGMGEDDPAGFVVQASQEGPALFVVVDDAEEVEDLPVHQGEVIDLEIEAADLKSDGTRVTEYGAVEKVRLYFPASMMTVDVTDEEELIEDLDSYESRLISADLTIESGPSSAGHNHDAFQVGTEGVGDEAGNSLMFRVPSYHVENLGLEVGCEIRLEDVPVGRYFEAVRLPMWKLYEADIVDCTPTEPVDVRVLDESRLIVDFNRALGGIGENGAEFSIEGLDIESTTYTFNDMILTTSDQTPGQQYTLEVEDTLTDFWGRQAGGSIDFTGFEPLEIAISELMARYQDGVTYPGDLGEFVELHNPGDEAFDLEGCILDRPDHDDELEIGDVTVPAGGEVVFTGEDGSDADYQVAGTLPFAVLNSGTTFELSCGGEILDTVTYEDYHVQLGVSYQKDAEFVATPNAGDDGFAGNLWCMTPEDDDYHYTDGAGDGQPKYGTPGGENVTCP